MNYEMKLNHPIQSTICAIWIAGIMSSTNIIGNEKVLYVPPIEYSQPEANASISFVEGSRTYDVKMFINLDKLNRMGEFENNWDGHGASSFSSEEIRLFKRIIRQLIWQPTIAPTAANGLVLQYVQGEKRLAYNIEKEKTERVYSPDGDINSAECEIIDTNTNIADDINAYAERVYG